MQRDNNIRKWRIYIHEQLAIDFKNKFYIYTDPNSQTKKIYIYPDILSNCINNTIKYSYSTLKIKYPRVNYNGKIQIINKDCLDLALTFRRTSNPVLLNMANAFTPGGGYANGAGAQEEQLFRRSCLHLCLKPSMYPLDIYDGIYSPNVVIISQNESMHYKRYSKLKTMSIITMAAYNNNKSNVSQETINKLMYKKIDMIFKMAMYNSHDTIILSAFGCGAFNNDPKIIASIFKKVIDYNYYRVYFKNIIFAIIDDFNSHGNYRSFKNIF